MFQAFVFIALRIFISNGRAPNNVPVFLYVSSNPEPNICVVVAGLPNVGVHVCTCLFARTIHRLPKHDWPKVLPSLQLLVQ